MQTHQVQCLLMGGQACVWYGAAEFSRDTDLALLASPENVRRLQSALRDLQAECIAVPPFELDFLERGHAIHFRCHHSDVAELRVDVMSRMRGVSPFPDLWARRTSITMDDGVLYDLLALPDLVQAKKTQRDKDWPMVRRLVEAHYFQNRDKPAEEQVRFWLQELRTPELLMEVARSHPESLDVIVERRPLLKLTQSEQFEELNRALHMEEQRERSLDREYWQPLKAELERLRHRAKDRPA